MRATKAMLSDAGAIGKALSEFLACPLSKQSLRQCPDTRCLVSDAIGVSFPVVNGIPCLVPKDGKLLEDNGSAASSNTTDGVDG